MASLLPSKILHLSSSIAITVVPNATFGATLPVNGLSDFVPFESLTDWNSVSETLIETSEDLELLQSGVVAPLRRRHK